MTYETQDREAYLSNFKQCKQAYSGLGIAVIVLFFVYMVGSYALMYATAYLLPDLYGQWWFQWVLNLVPLYCLALPAFYLCLRRVDKGRHDPTYVSYGLIYEKPRFHLGHFCLFAVVAFGLMYMGSLVGNGLMSWMSQKLNYDYQNGLNDLAATSPWWMLLLGSVIIAPIGEEFIFRKLFIDRARRYGDGMAILLSALLFALFHGNFFQFFYAFLVGGLMAYLYTLTGKLYWSAGLHMFMNFMGMMVIPKLTSLLGMEELNAIDPNDVEAMEAYMMSHMGAYIGLALFSLLIYGAMIASVVIIIYHIRKKKIYLGAGETPLRSEDRGLAAFGNKGIAICILLLCLLMAMNLIPVPQ